MAPVNDRDPRGRIASRISTAALGGRRSFSLRSRLPTAAGNALPVSPTSETLNSQTGRSASTAAWRLA